MKKTIIALLTLSGMAMADVFTTFSDVKYAQMADYELAITLNALNYTNDSNFLIKTDSAVHLFTQMGRYVGVENSGSGGVDGNLGYGKTSYDIEAGVTEGWFLDLSKQNAIQGMTITFEGNYADKSTTITLSKADMNSITLNVNAFINPEKIALNTTKVTSAAHTYSNVPEPTTGSLSLLALAGLCARRRKH